MIAPQLRSIGAFDATDNTEIQFSVSGINAYTNKVIFTVFNNETNTQVHQGTYNFYLDEMFFVLPPNVLVNDVYYKAYIQVVSQDGEVSPISNSVVFYCEPRPIFRFFGLNDVIKVSTIQLSVIYDNTSQKIYDTMQSYVISLYDSKGGEIYNSDVVYSQQEIENTGKISGLVEDVYTARATGVTLNGFLMECEQTFTIKFDIAKTFSAIELDNLFDRGQIRVASNIIGLKGEITGEEKYTPDGMIDLSDPANEVTFSKGFEIESDFYIKLWMKHIETNIQDNFLELSNDKGYSIKLRWRKSDFKENNGLVSYIELLATNGILTYTMKSNYITEEIALTDVYFIGLKRRNNLYELKVYKVEAA